MSTTFYDPNTFFWHVYEAISHSSPACEPLNQLVSWYTPERKHFWQVNQKGPGPTSAMQVPLEIFVQMGFTQGLGWLQATYASSFLQIRFMQLPVSRTGCVHRNKSNLL